MPARLVSLAALSAVALAACSGAERATEPLAPPAPSIASTDVCDGTGVTVAECKALVALYNSTGGDSWSPYNDNWGANNNPCTWENAVCPGNGDVGPLTAILFLGGNQMRGTLPSDLGNLFGLTGILFQLNPELTGPIPPELGNLANLVALHLDFNALTGPIPATLGNLAQLEILNLAHNQLTGVVPVSVAMLDDGLMACDLTGNEGLFIPDLQAYRDADTDGDRSICGLELVSAEDISESAVDGIEELVPEPLNGGEANALSTKIENAIDKAAKSNYQAAINQLNAFLTQLDDMVTSGTLSAAQASPLIEQAEALIAIWTEEL